MMTSHLRGAIALAVVGATGLGLAPPAHGAPPTPPAPAAGLPLKRAEPKALAAARTQVRALEGSVAATRRAEAGARERLAGLETRAAALAGRLNELSARERELAEQLGAARERLRKLAVASYVNGGSSSSVDYLLRAESPADLSRRRKLLTSVGRVRNRAVKDYAAARQAASEQLQRSVADLDHVKAASVTARAELEAATSQIGRLTAELDRARERRKLLLAVTPVAGLDIPGLFFDAYRAAADAMAELNPRCALRWTALAGVGRIESNHGRSGEATLSLHGDISPPIIGIPLDGNNSTALIPDTDRGALDGDVVVDRAVGPMQVIPSTWRVVARDGNGDKIEDPNNVFDAALTAAAYLCRAAPGGLTADAGLQAAFFSYNHSEAYSLTALHWSKVYDAFRPPREPIVPV
jgi:membrane-bound lytic murein transglycosylase B